MKTRNEGCKILRWNQTFSCSKIRTTFFPSFPPARKINFKSHPQLSIMWQRLMGRNPGTGGGGKEKDGFKTRSWKWRGKLFFIHHFKSKVFGPNSPLDQEIDSIIYSRIQKVENLANRFVKSQLLWTPIGERVAEEALVGMEKAKITSRIPICCGSIGSLRPIRGTFTYRSRRISVSSHGIGNYCAAVSVHT